MSNDYQKGFDDAIDRVLHFAEEEIKRHKNITADRINEKMDNRIFKIRTNCLVDFKDSLIQIFKQELMEDEAIHAPQNK
jgi:hypothetical protein